VRENENSLSPSIHLSIYPSSAANNRVNDIFNKNSFDRRRANFLRGARLSSYAELLRNFDHLKHPKKPKSATVLQISSYKMNFDGSLSRIIAGNDFHHVICNQSIKVIS